MSEARCAYPGCGEWEKVGFNGGLLVMKGPAIGWWCSLHKDVGRSQTRHWLFTQPAWSPPPPKIPPKAPAGWKPPD